MQAKAFLTPLVGLLAVVLTVFVVVIVVLAATAEAIADLACLFQLRKQHVDLATLETRDRLQGTGARAHVYTCGRPRVRACGRARVRACGRARVCARVRVPGVFEGGWAGVGGGVHSSVDVCGVC